MNAEFFNEFVKKFKVFEYMKLNYPETTSSSYGIPIKDGEHAKKFLHNINRGILNARIFEVDEGVKKLLCLTDTPSKNDELHLPFPVMFIDIDFRREELAELGIKIQNKRIVGILAQRGLLQDEGLIIGEDLNICILSETDEKEILFDDFNKNCNIHEEYRDVVGHSVMENPTSDKKARDFTHRFFLNFLNFINNPDVEYIEHKRSEGNIRRKLKKRKVVIPSTCSIKVTGKLKVYLDDIIGGKEFSYSHSFWVRGHFRDLVADRYIHKKRIWILPYIKGSGVLVEKTYKVERKK